MASHPPPPPDYGIVRRAEETQKRIQDAAHEAAERSAKAEQARREREAADRARREQERRGNETRRR